MNIYFYKKIDTITVLLKTELVRSVPFKSFKLEEKTIEKVFQKVDTLRTYQLPLSAIDNGHWTYPLILTDKNNAATVTIVRVSPGASN